MVPSNHMRLTHLRTLEAESIHILREVASEFQRPVMLYSIGKDSSVLLRLAQKAFYPGPFHFHCYMWIPHINLRKCWSSAIDILRRTRRRTCWSIPNREAHRRRHPAIQPRHPALLRAAEDQGPARRARQVGTSTLPSAGPGATRRSPAPRSASSLSAIARPMGSQEPAAPNSGTSSTPHPPGESIRVFPLSNWTELDIWQYIHAENIPIVISTSPKSDR